jgi:AAA ATPase domain
MPWKQKLPRRALPAALDTISHVVPERAQPGSIKAFVSLPPGRVSTATGLTPLVGREAELCLLLERWEHAKAGEGQVVLLAGEAGIGKSRLMETLRQRVAAEPHIRLRYQCSPYAINSAFAQAHATYCQQICGDWRATQAAAETLITLTVEQGFPHWIAAGTMLRGWALAVQGQAEEGIAQIRHGLIAWQHTGSELAVPYFLALLAEAYGKGGQSDAGVQTLYETLAVVEKTGERWLEAELYRARMAGWHCSPPGTRPVAVRTASQRSTAGIGPTARLHASARSSGVSIEPPGGSPTGQPTTTPLYHGGAPTSSKHGADSERMWLGGGVRQGTGLAIPLRCTLCTGLDTLPHFPAECINHGI